MTLVNKWAALLELESIPAYCCNCGAEAVFRNSSEVVIKALHDASYIQSFTDEIALLQRTKALFERFPDSRHPVKINHESPPSQRTQVQADVMFEQALAGDAELSDFLKTTGFWLPARLSSISKASAEWQERLDDSQIRCTTCNVGHYVIDTVLFDQLI